MNDATPSIEQLPNLGPKSAEMLRAAGLRTLADLRAAGPVAAYLRVKQTGARPGKNLLWALHGALHNKPWNKLTETERRGLLTELEELAGG